MIKLRRGVLIYVQQFYRGSERNRSDVLFNGNRRVREISKVVDRRRTQSHEQNGFPRVFLLHDVLFNLHDGTCNEFSPKINVIRSVRGVNNFFPAHADYPTN